MMAEVACIKAMIVLYNSRVGSEGRILKWWVTVKPTANTTSFVWAREDLPEECMTTCFNKHVKN